MADKVPEAKVTAKAIGHAATDKVLSAIQKPTGLLDGPAPVPTC